MRQALLIVLWFLGIIFSVILGNLATLFVLAWLVRTYNL